MRHSNLSPVEPETFDESATTDHSAALAELGSKYLTVLKSGAGIAATDQFANYDFPEANRERDRRILNWVFGDKAQAAYQSKAETKPVSGYSDADKVAYATAFFNAGGTVAGSYVAPYAFPAEMGVQMSMLAECIDRVRWDVMCLASESDAKYEDNRTAADIKDRAPACAQIRAAIMGENPSLTSRYTPGQSYLDLVLAKAQEVLSMRHPVRTRVSKKTDKAIPVD